MRRNLITLILVICITYSFAQKAFQVTELEYAKNYSVQNSAKFILEGIKLHDDEEYEEAVEEYDKVHRNDTNYSLAIYEKSLSLLRNDKNMETIEACKIGLTLNSKYDADFYITYGTALSNLEKYDEAIEIYSKGIKKYNFNSSLKYNRAVTYMEAKKYKKGLELLYANIRENPYHANSHKLLGDICASMNYESQALMAYLFYFIAENRAKSNVNKIITVEKYLMGSMEGEEEYEGIDLNQGYDDLDELINNKVAINKKYKVPSSFDYPIVKQAHFLMKQLDEIDEEKGFWNEFYRPIFQKTYNEDYFEGFSYFIVRYLGDYNAATKKTLTKKASYTKSFLGWYRPYFNENLAITNQKLGDEMKKTTMHFRSSKIIGYGDLNDEGKIDGSFVFINRFGSIESMGEYDNGTKKGLWKYYYVNGIQSSEVTFSDGERNGPFKSFNKKGVLIKGGTFKNDFYNGKLNYYYSIGGGIERTEEYDEGKLEGLLVYYHENGEKRFEAEIKDNKIDGYRKTFATNKQLLSEVNYNEGERYGVQKKYFWNGVLQSEQEFKEGSMVGFYKKYFKNGKIEEEGNYVKGKLAGESTAYHDNGEVDVKNFFDENGKKNGVSKSYSYKGVLLSEYTYKKGDLVSYKFFNADGKVIGEGAKKGKKLEFEKYDKLGFVRRKGTMIKDSRDGAWKYYQVLGYKDMTLNFKNGERDGIQKDFYLNGNLYLKYNSEEGLDTGDFYQYSRNGEISYYGYTRKGDKVGEWVSLNELGTVTKRSYYKDEELNGWQYYYGASGNIGKESLYKNGNLVGTVFYDSLGNPWDTVMINNGNGAFKQLYMNGEIKFIGHYKNGKAEGEFTWYYPNGKLDTKGAYVNGQRNGKWTSYFDDGTVFYEKYYNYGSKIEIWTRYHRNGKKNIVTPYKYGDINGTKTIYYKNGSVRQEKVYKDDEMNGEVKYYSQDGSLGMVRKYSESIFLSYSYKGKDGKLVEFIPVSKGENHIVSYFENGNKSFDYILNKGYFEGEFKSYFSNGKAYKEIMYKNGETHGKYRIYFTNGKLEWDENYNFGEEHGTSLFYYKNGKVNKQRTYHMGDLHGNYKIFDKNGNLTSDRTYFNDFFYGGKY